MLVLGAWTLVVGVVATFFGFPNHYLLLALAGGLVVIALIDFPIQWIRRMMRLKMSQQEMRDEHKEAEGSPENKAAQRQRARLVLGKRFRIGLPAPVGQATLGRRLAL